MEPRIQAQLLAINRRFYDQFAPSFSVTRGRVQPGVRSLLPDLLKAKAILDVGCGNGTLARALAGEGFKGQYLGADMSAGLLAEARALLGSPPQGAFNFHQADITNPDWADALPIGPYDRVVSFAVLHHLPGEALRLQTVRTFAKLLSGAGQVAVSVWQWQNSSRLHKHLLPWAELELADAEVDEGDVLLDWRAGDQMGMRYVHTFNEISLTALAEAAGFRVRESFFADGKPGNLALYQIWQQSET